MVPSVLAIDSGRRARRDIVVGMNTQSVQCTVLYSVLCTVHHPQPLLYTQSRMSLTMGNVWDGKIINIKHLCNINDVLGDPRALDIKTARNMEDTTEHQPASNADLQSGPILRRKNQYFPSEESAHDPSSVGVARKGRGPII